MNQTIKINFRNLVDAELELRDLEFERLFVKEIWTGEYYFKNNLNILKGDVVLDVGGHIGIFAVLAGLLGAKTYVFEPVAENYPLLVRNIVRNHLMNVIPYPLALMKEDVFTTVNVPMEAVPNRNTGTSYIGRGRKDHNSLKAIGVSFAEAVEAITAREGKNISFLKMDIEGMEYDLLYTLPAKLYSKIDKISMEFHNSLYTNEWFGKKDPELMRRTLEEGQNLVNFLQSLGYTTYLDYAHGAQGRIQATR